VERLKWVIKSVNSGVSVNASDQPVEGDGLGVLKTSAVAGGVFLPGENKSVWDTEYGRLTCPVTRDTIIMSRMNTPNLVGESGQVVGDYPNLYLPDRLWQISFDTSRIFVPFMSLLLASKEARHALSAMATGTSPSMKNLTIEEMVSLVVPVPPLEEQEYVYEEVAMREATIAPLRKELGNSLSLLKERRAALITAAVTGRIPLEEMTG
jgi:type I restriction enzyme S subunit